MKPKLKKFIKWLPVIGVLVTSAAFGQNVRNSRLNAPIGIYLNLDDVGNLDKVAEFAGADGTLDLIIGAKFSSLSTGIGHIDGSGNLTSSLIINADVDASAGIVDTKLATISTAGKVSGNAITSGTIGGSTILNTSGSITTIGAFTSLGIDDNATSTAITINSSEQVGIGDPSPGYKLTINGPHATGVNIPVRITGSNGSDNDSDKLAWMFGTSQEFAYIEHIRTNTSAGYSELAFGVSSGSVFEAMRLDRLGDLSIPAGVIKMPNGSAASPSYTFAADSSLNSGFYAVSDDVLGFSTSGFVKMQIAANGISVVDGQAAVPGYSFINDPNNGMWRSATDTINFVTGSQERLEMASTGFVVNDDGHDVDFRVEGDTQNVLHVDASVDEVQLKVPTDSNCDSFVAGGNVCSGTYTPTFTNEGTSLDALPGLAHGIPWSFIRVGDVVSVAGHIHVDKKASTTGTAGVTVPITRTGGSVGFGYAAGTSTAQGVATSVGGRVNWAGSGTTKAIIVYTWTDATNLGVSDYSIQFQYRLN